MRLRTAAVIAVTSAFAAGAVPAFAYWSQPVTVEVTVRAVQLTAPHPIGIARSGPHGSLVTLQWSGGVEPAAPATRYQVERAALDAQGRPEGGSWRALPSPPSCSPDASCSVTDQDAPLAAVYRVTAETGTWRSPHSEVVRSLVIVAHALPAPASTGADPTGSDPTGTDSAGSEPTVGTELVATPDPSGGTSCGTVQTEWKFAVPSFVRELKQPLVTVPSAPAGLAVQRASNDGWDEVAPDASGTATLDPALLSGDLILRSCPPVGTAPPESAPVLVVNG